jgi:hypothetical protein
MPQPGCILWGETEVGSPENPAFTSTRANLTDFVQSLCIDIIFLAKVLPPLPFSFETLKGNKGPRNNNQAVRCMWRFETANSGNILTTSVTYEKNSLAIIGGA